VTCTRKQEPCVHPRNNTLSTSQGGDVLAAQALLLQPAIKPKRWRGQNKKLGKEKRESKKKKYSIYNHARLPIFHATHALQPTNDLFHSPHPPTK